MNMNYFVIIWAASSILMAGWLSLIIGPEYFLRLPWGAKLRWLGIMLMPGASTLIGLWALIVLVYVSSKR